MSMTAYRCWDSHGPNGHAPRTYNTPRDQIHLIHVHDHQNFVLSHWTFPDSFHCLVPYHAYFHLSIVLGPDLVDLGPLTDLCHLSLIFPLGDETLSQRAQWSPQETLLAQCSWDIAD